MPRVLKGKPQPLLSRSDLTRSVCRVSALVLSALLLFMFPYKSHEEGRLYSFPDEEMEIQFVSIRV